MSSYDIASHILLKLEAKAGTLKSLCLADNIKEKKKMFGLVCETLKYKQVLDSLISACSLLKAEKKLKRTLALVLVYELLFGKGIAALGKYKDVINRHKTRLNAELVKYKIKHKVKDNKDLIPDKIRNCVTLPRYVRVNLLKASLEQVIEAFVEEGYVENDSKMEIKDMSKKSFQKDRHVTDLLVFPPGTDLHAHKLLLDGSIILQDKASCFPAYILNPPKGSIIIDACAAPGNKTSHLASIIRNEGTIYALDADKKRLQTLIKLCDRSGCSSVIPMHQNFLELSPKDPKFSKVQYILLDPSCSGSGIVSRFDHLTEEIEVEQETPEQVSERLKSLAEFQLKALLHAFKFPNLKQVVYSTCSINKEENEDVVEKALKSTQGKKFSLVARDGVLPSWKRRGEKVGDINDGQGLVRASPMDNTNGFFVALFTRK